MKMVALRWPEHVAVFCKIYVVYMTDCLHAMKGCRKVYRLQLVMSLNPTTEIIASNHYFFPPVALRPNAGHGLLILEVSRSHTTTHHSR